MLKRLSALATRTPGVSERAPHRRAHHWFGWAGLAFGVVALGLALLPGWVAPLYDPPSKPIPQQAADWLGELKDKTVAAIRMESVPPPPPEFSALVKGLPSVAPPPALPGAPRAWLPSG